MKGKISSPLPNAMEVRQRIDGGEIKAKHNALEAALASGVHIGVPWARKIVLLSHAHLAVSIVAACVSTDSARLSLTTRSRKRRQRGD